jgi:S-adenosylmethionine hydrolase
LPVLAEHRGHFFLGEDNGVFSLMFGSDSNDKAIQYADNEKKIFLPRKYWRWQNGFFENDLATHTVEYHQFKRKLKVEPDYNPENKIITGKIAYIDSCCNAVTDIPISMFKEAGRNRKFTAMISNRKHLKITRYHEFYNPEEDEVFFVFNRLGYLEITMFQGNIAVLGNLMVGDTVEIKFD